MIPGWFEQDCEVSASSLLRFAAGDSRGEERRRILEHLLAGCSRCREALQALRELGDQPPAEDSADDGESPSISRILANLSEKASRIEQERAEARELMPGFLSHPTARQWTLVRNSKRFDSWSFCAQLLDASLEAIYDDPKRALELAAMAREISDRLDGEVYGERAIHDLQGRAWAHLGNSRRALGDLDGAAEALRSARKCLEAGTGDPLDEAELLYFEASLLRGRRRLDDALKKVRRSIRLYRELGDAHLEGRSRLNEASILSVQGDAFAAVESDRLALPLVDPERDPHLGLAVRHNLVWHSMEAGLSAEALSMLGEFRAEYERIGDRSSQLRLAWLEARLLQQADRAEDSRRAFEAAISGFADAELPYETAMASLDLTLLLAEAGSGAEVRRVAAETLVLFRSLGVAREMIAAWMVFQKAAEADAVTGALVERLASYFSAARHRPELVFER